MPQPSTTSSDSNEIPGGSNPQGTVPQAAPALANPSLLKAFDLIDVVMSETLGMSMHNAVTAQQNAQMSATAAVTAACAKMLQMPLMGGGTPHSGMGIPSPGGPSAGMPATGAPATGSPAAGSPAAGSPVAGMPATGAPAAGSTAGTSSNAASSKPQSASGQETSRQSASEEPPNRNGHNYDKPALYATPVGHENESVPLASKPTEAHPHKEPPLQEKIELEKLHLYEKLATNAGA